VAGLTLDWHQDGQQATIRQGGVLVNAARLVGVPFLLAGAYLLYHFVSGALNRDLTVVGWIALPPLGLGVALAGWCLLAWRRRARLDNARCQVTEELDFVLFKRRQVVPVHGDSVVRLRYERGSSSTRGTPRYDIHVDVVTPRQRDAMIGLFSEEQRSEAAAFAAKAAAFLGVKVQDKMVERGEVNSGGVVVEALDPEEAD
jgi:hypothetical protein